MMPLVREYQPRKRECNASIKLETMRDKFHSLVQMYRSKLHLSIFVLFLSFVCVLAAGDSKALTNFISIQAKRFGIDAKDCLNALAVCHKDGKSGMSTTTQVLIAVGVIVALIALMKFVQFVIKIIVGHAVALGLLYVLARYVPFMRKYFIEVLSRKAA